MLQDQSDFTIWRVAKNESPRNTSKAGLLNFQVQHVWFGGRQSERASDVGNCRSQFYLSASRSCLNDSDTIVKYPKEDLKKSLLADFVWTWARPEDGQHLSTKKVVKVGNKPRRRVVFLLSLAIYLAMFLNEVRLLWLTVWWSSRALTYYLSQETFQVGTFLFA